jgi:hypothetical protein
VLQADGGNYSVCVNAATLAIIDAGIPMRDYVCACTVGFVDETPLADLCFAEESGSSLALALLPRGGRSGSHHHHHHHHHQPLLLSRLVILDRGHVGTGGPGGPAQTPRSPSGAARFTQAPAQGLQLLSGALYPSRASLDSPPSYSQAVLDVR